MASAAEQLSSSLMIDEAYEFSAPQFYDFMSEETEEDVRRAEHWFENSGAYAPSPFMPRIRATTTDEQILCNFSEDDKMQKLPKSSESAPVPSNSAEELAPKSLIQTSHQAEAISVETTGEVSTHISPKKFQSGTREVSLMRSNASLSQSDVAGAMQRKSNLTLTRPKAPEFETSHRIRSVKIKSSAEIEEEMMVKIPKFKARPLNKKIFEGPTLPPLPRSTPHLPEFKEFHLETMSRATHNVKTSTVATEVKSDVAGATQRNSNLTLTRHKAPEFKTSHRIRSVKIKSSAEIEEETMAKIPMFKARPLYFAAFMPIIRATRTIIQILCNFNKDDKMQKLPKSSESAPVPSNSAEELTPKSLIQTLHQAEAITVETTGEVSTHISPKKFQSGTREVSLMRSNASLSQSDVAGATQTKSNLTLTRPKAPEFETSHRIRSVKIKSSAEIEEEMMAKIPKFKARPLNKKLIFEGSTLPPFPRSTPHLPEFKEFHLETMSRATHNAKTSTVALTESTEVKSHQWKPHHLTAPKSPVLQTSLRARPPRIKSSEELEREELENISQFKARPLNRKIFECKGDMGIFCNTKKQVTVPREFNFAIDKRIPPPTAVVDLFDKLSVCLKSCGNHLRRNTTTNPFHLHTEERGAEKKRRIAEELMQKQLEEERARIPRAQPYPYSTDYPVIPPWPEPKPCTKPEPFELESLMRHEQEMQKEMEERMRMEKEEAEIRRFKAQPILKEDPIPLREKERRPLTEVRGFNLHVENRAADRAEFDKKVAIQFMT